MKINISPSRAIRGTVLVVILTVVAVAAIVLASYLIMIQTQSAAVSRSQTWNTAISVTEAGVEDALALINKGMPAVIVNAANAWTWTNSLASEGWSSFAANGTSVTRYVAGSNYYTVSVSISSSNTPLISSVGSVPYTMIPWVFSSAAQPFLADAGVSASGLTTIARRVRVATYLQPLFPMGLETINNINMNGNNLLSDSFDSADPLHSTGGLYDPSKRKADGDVASDSGLVNSLSIGNANIYGEVHTGPSGTVSVGANGSVGDLAWQAAGNSGIEPGFDKNDMNVVYPDVATPASGGVPPLPGIYGLTSYTYALTGGSYQMSSLSLSGSQGMIVTGPSVLWVTGNVSMSGQSSITIAPGGSLVMYVGTASGSGTSASLSGVINNAGNADDFAFYGLPSLTSLSMSGNGTFTGTIYAPEADLTLNGGGSGNQDFSGASVTKSATLNGHFSFHFDENLLRAGPSRGWVATSWKEN